MPSFDLADFDADLALQRGRLAAAGFGEVIVVDLALRAAETAAYGMIGVGRIFEAYRDGVLEDDDGVALAHAGPEDGYRATAGFVKVLYAGPDTAPAPQAGLVAVLDAR